MTQSCAREARTQPGPVGHAGEASGTSVGGAGPMTRRNGGMRSSAEALRAGHRHAGWADPRPAVDMATSWGGPGAQQGVPRGAPRPQPPHLAVARAHANRPGKRGVPSGGRRVELGPICLSLLRSFHVSEVFETGLSKRVSAPRY